MMLMWRVTKVTKGGDFRLADVSQASEGWECGEGAGGVHGRAPPSKSLKLNYVTSGSALVGAVILLSALVTPARAATGFCPSP